MDDKKVEYAISQTIGSFKFDNLELSEEFVNSVREKISETSKEDNHAKQRILVK